MGWFFSGRRSGENAAVQHFWRWLHDQRYRPVGASSIERCVRFRRRAVFGDGVFWGTSELGAAAVLLRAARAKQEAIRHNRVKTAMLTFHRQLWLVLLVFWRARKRKWISFYDR